MYIILKKRHIFIIALFFLIVSSIGLISGGKYQSTAPSISWAIADETIVIDPGHGGIFPGKISITANEEKNINLSIAQKLQNYLLSSGATIIMTRTTDTELCDTTDEMSLLNLRRADLQRRTDIAKQANADYFISIHCNSISSPQWHGAQVFYRPNDPASESLAIAIQNRLTEQLKNTDRQAIVRDDTYLFHNLDIPTVIVECGFLSNPTEDELLLDELYQQKIAHAIYLGISDYLSS